MTTVATTCNNASTFQAKSPNSHNNNLILGQKPTTKMQATK